jgi:hypothetical protein
MSKQLLKSTLNSTGKLLTLASFGLNGLAFGGTFAQEITNSSLLSLQSSLNGLLTNYPKAQLYIGLGCMSLKSLGTQGKNFTDIPSMLYDPKNNGKALVDSGIAGFAELYFSKGLLGQTTHFGLVPQVLKCYYGTDQVSQKLPLALLGMGAFEVAYWWFGCDQPEAHPELA